jgi:hypothetical protein
MLMVKNKLSNTIHTVLTQFKLNLKNTDHELVVPNDHHKIGCFFFNQLTGGWPQKSSLL